MPGGDIKLYAGVDPRLVIPGRADVSYSGIAPSILIGGGSPQPALAEPVYSTFGGQKKLHLEEDWSNINVIGDLFSATRPDGGPAHQLHFGNNNIHQNVGGMPNSPYGSVVSQSDGWGSAKFIRIDKDSDPGWDAHGSHGSWHWWIDTSCNVAQNVGRSQRGFHLGSFINAPGLDSIVYEFVYRFSGTNFYEGKLYDVGSATDLIGRFNYDPDGWNLGVGQPFNCDTDLKICSKYYSNQGATPRFAGLPPTHNYHAPMCFRQSSAGPLAAAAGNAVVNYKQNLNWGTGAGQFDYQTNWDMTGTGKAPTSNIWLKTKIRLTRETGSQTFGQGRYEIWVGVQPTYGEGSMVKIWEYVGDDPTNTAYDVTWIDPSATHDHPWPATPHLGATVVTWYAGGCTSHDWGMQRIWSHEKLPLS